VISLSLSFLLSGAAIAAPVSPVSGLAAQAKVSMSNARHIALQAYIKQELEKEAGGSGLRYSFDIKSAKGTHELGVDAKPDKLLENSLEGDDND
jgi:hypothetical protein